MCDCWRISPLTRSCMASSCGSPSSSGVTIQGPIGQKVSIPLERLNTPDFISSRWMSRAVMSLKMEVSGDVVLGLLGRKNLPHPADLHAHLELVVQLVGQPVLHL